MSDSSSISNRSASRAAAAVVTAGDLSAFEPGSVVRLAPNARLTPLAEDVVRERGLTLVRDSGGAVAIGADHGGFEMKREVAAFLRSRGRDVIDLGTHSADPVDYPDFAFAVASAVALGDASIGVVVDAAGIGSAMTANKVPGVRAAACYTEALARNARQHNGANVLSLGSRIVTVEEMRAIVAAFLDSDLTEERHARRVSKIVDVERRFSR